MVITVENSVQEKFVRIYTSTDLKKWSFASDFGKGEGNHDGVWEVPDLFELPIDGDVNNTKWVMQVSLSNGSTAGGSGVQYFIGSFDGTTFTNDNPASTILYADYGADYYAPITFDNIPSTDGRRIAMGWMNNWSYGQSIPTSIWKSKMSIPRELTLKNVEGEGVRLVQNPVSEFESLRNTADSWTNETVSPGNSLLSNVTGDTLEIVAEFKTDTATAKEFGFKVRTGSGDKTTIGYDMVNSKIFVDRTDSGQSNFNSTFAARHEANMSPENNTVTLRILVDRSSVEVFGNNGKVVITDQIFPLLQSNGLEIYSVDGDVTVNKLDIHQLNSATITSN
ncbi:glycoside hydrolase family 32 protein [Litchfieldia salsa]|uniref:Fructan beta-fructosidase n=1 Tax=Litchfieldia salsa TaxID=930152 RepID=A0A1H0WRN6_9BACI|nr:GH32 C-terminal domain-containing protein [Litchfieldia salsa]SDP93299.1 fructan beta-fructosidase [Litchfieldia salsa]